MKSNICLWGGGRKPPPLLVYPLVGTEAHTTTAPASTKIRICLGKFMAALTVSFFGVYGGNANPPQQVFSLAYSLQVIGIYAKAVATKMVYLQSEWNGAVFKFVRKAVRVAHFSVIPKNSVISVFPARPRRQPFPTRSGFSNLLKEEGYGFDWACSHTACLAHYHAGRQ